MLSLPFETIIEICGFISDREKIRLSAISKSMEQLKYKLSYHENIHVNAISNLPYFDNFRSVRISSANDTYPKYAACIYMRFDRRFNDSIVDKIPLYVTHLNLSRCVSTLTPAIPFIPPSVKYLNIYQFDYVIERGIPNTVTHLTLCTKFGLMPKSLSSSVTHLTFDDPFDEPVNGLIPASVTHLKFGTYFNKTLENCIPASVVELVIDKKYRKFISEDIRSRVNVVRV